MTQVANCAQKVEGAARGWVGRTGVDAASGRAGERVAP